MGLLMTKKKTNVFNGNQKIQRGNKNICRQSNRTNILWQKIILGKEHQIGEIKVTTR